jgi:hypothetical protein
MRKNIYKALALGLLAALGLAVSAYAMPQKTTWHWKPDTTTAAATTTTAATTTVATTTDSTTQPTTASTVKIWSPSPNQAYQARYSNVILGVIVTGAVAGGTCTIDWGDGTFGAAPLVPNGSDYSCSATHQYQSSGRPTIRVAAGYAGLPPVGTDCVSIYVI